MCRAAAVLIGVIALSLANAARAETFLLKGGARIYGVREKSTGESNWVTVRTCYGIVSFPKKDIKKVLKPSRDRETLYVEEALVTYLEGLAFRSDDGGTTWEKIRWKVEPGKTGTPGVLPIRIKAGSSVKTAIASKLVLDVGWGTVQLQPESTLKLRNHEGATLKVERGRVGIHVEGLSKEQRFRVETVQASLGVTGTTFVVQAGPVTHLAVLDGTILAHGQSVKAPAAVAVSNSGVSPPVAPRPEDRLLAEEVRGRAQIPRIEWVRIPAGEYIMRRVPSEPPGRPRKRVQIEGFLLGRYEVTQSQYLLFSRWLKVNGDQGLWPDGKPKTTEYRSGTELPVWEWEDESWRAPDICAYGLCWTAAQAFSRWVGGRLPTEAEWEHAATAGGTPRGYVHDFGWTAHNSGKAADLLTKAQVGNGRWEVVRTLGCRPRPVGLKHPHPFGLFDMLGNVYEWVADEAVPEQGTRPSGVLHVGKGMDIHCSGPAWSYWFAQRRTVPVGDRLGGIRVVRSLPR